jgi:hypothetical protein
MPCTLPSGTSLTRGVSLRATPNVFICLDRVYSSHADRRMRSAHNVEFAPRSLPATVSIPEQMDVAEQTTDRESFDLDRRDTSPRFRAHLTAPGSNNAHLDTNGNPLRPFDD